MADIDQLVLPQDPNKQRELKIMLNEVLASITKIEQETEHKKEVIDEIVGKFELPKKVVGKLISTLHRHNFQDIQKEHELLELLHDVVVK